MLKLNLNKEGSSLFLLPFLPENLEITQAISKELIRLNPDGIALVLPPFLKEDWVSAVKALPTITVLEIHYKDETVEYLIVSPLCPLVEATRYALRFKKDLYFVDLPCKEEEIFEVKGLVSSCFLPAMGYQAYTETFLSGLINRGLSFEVKPKHRYIANKLLHYSKKGLVAVVLPYHFVPGVLKALEHPDNLYFFPEKQAVEINLYSLHPQSIREVLAEPGFFQQTYEEKREEIFAKPDFWLNRVSLWEDVLTKAIAKFKDETGTVLSPKDLKVLGQFLKNYLLVRGNYFPELFDLVVAARGVGGDELAFWVWEIATAYELKREEIAYPEIKLSPEELNLSVKKLRLFRKVKSLRAGLKFLQKFASREERKKFAQRFSGKTICSFPPEDIVVETFGKKASEKGIKVITENLRKIEPFISSLKDGLDIRETIRNWFFKEMIYIREEPKTNAKIGSLVIIFEEDPDPITGEEKYPWNFTWHGEHHQESDMAFYATDPKEKVIGPGIARAKYGGFMLTYPPKRVYDIWTDPLFSLAENKPERLLLAAIDYSLEKYVLYIAKKPPTSFAKNWAFRQGKKVIFLPIGSFSKNLLEKVRTFHVLEGAHVREYAHKFIDK
ncbi:hypothetical protein F1847_02240 [Thermodesulfobacterium sp. TA1]|uniref:hypothetical protein n=1 Tax=Thermodesulfobacterium sp. TA1 TaxID=2234087 RepID=UPI001232923E|nr:hypothetical protein [Thermodesulfobacterium sp. TA1]QER41619.1 hypothetical protein F1847_02240 [Thermodesulfobacterium sp. TA1]